MTGGTPTKLAIVSINNGHSPTVNIPFSVVVQARDILNLPANVSQNTEIQLSLVTGTGSLGGTLIDTILQNENSVTISGVTYDSAQSNVAIKASRITGDLLTPDTSDPFTVLPSASQLTFAGVPIGAQLNIKMGSFTVEARRPAPYNTIDSTFTDSITISKASGPGNVSGNLKKACVAGIATFDSICFDASGAYTLSALATGLTPDISGTINISPIEIPLIENFDYTGGTSLVYNGWSAHSGAGSNPVMVTSPGLTYPSYLSSGIGNAAKIHGSGEDVNRIFTSQTSGSIYAAFMVKVDSAPTGWDYFLHFGPQTIGTTYKGKLFVKKIGSDSLSFGISKGNNAPPVDSTPFSYKLDSTYLLVLKYTFVEGTNDEVKLWINPSVTGPEPLANLTVTDATSDLNNCGSFALRQSSSSLTATIDGIRIGTSWGIVSGNYPPTISDVTRNPEFPRVGNSVHISAKIYDDSTNINNISDTLYYALNTTSSWTAVMKDSSRTADSLFFYTIPLIGAEGDTCLL